MYDNDLTITDTGVVLEEDANSNLNAVDVDDEYWKEVRINLIIVTDRPTPKIIRVQAFGMFLIVVQNSDYDEENIDPINYNNDSSINNKPNVRNTVIDDGNKFGIIGN